MSRASYIDQISISALRHDGIKWINQVFLPDGQFMNNFDGITILIALQLAPIIILLRAWWRKQSAMDGFHHRFAILFRCNEVACCWNVFDFYCRSPIFKRIFEICQQFLIFLKLWLVLFFFKYNEKSSQINFFIVYICRKI